MGPGGGGGGRQFKSIAIACHFKTESPLPGVTYWTLSGRFGIVFGNQLQVFDRPLYFLMRQFMPKL